MSDTNATLTLYSLVKILWPGSVFFSLVFRQKYSLAAGHRASALTEGDSQWRSPISLEEAEANESPQLLCPFDWERLRPMKYPHGFCQAILNKTMAM